VPVKMVQPSETIVHYYDLTDDQEDADAEKEYISGTIPVSPTGTTYGTLTRLRARVESMVIPDPCNDIPSETEETPVQSQSHLLEDASPLLAPRQPSRSWLGWVTRGPRCKTSTDSKDSSTGPQPEATHSGTA
jgi:hypothetical protein